MRRANLLPTLAGMLFAAMTLASAVAAPLPATQADESAPFSLIRIAKPPNVDRPVWRLQTARSPTATRPTVFGYPSANADELSPPAAIPVTTLLFTHAALGVALLDATPADNWGDAIHHTDAGGFGAGQLKLSMPAQPHDQQPAPLPIMLIVAMVLLPAGLVLGQALIGPSRRPRVALRRRD